MSRSLSALLIALAVVVPVRLEAQARLTGADLQGTVSDESGGVLPAAAVTVTNVETNLTRTATSDGKGRYVVAALPPGTYKVSVALSGFAPRARDKVTLLLGQTVEVDFTLKVASAREEVTVTDEAPVVNPTQTAVSSVVGQQQIENLPINGRNFISFSVITPGVTTDRTPQQGSTATSGLSFMGQRARSNNIMVDGLDNNDTITGGVASSFSQEAVREFQVLTNSCSAEFGKATGGIVNIVTKSGTNEIHGNTFLYLRDESLNAREHFEKFDPSGQPIDREKAPYRQRQWGATLGGPLQKDKTFFFLSGERIDVTANNFVTIAPATAEVLRRNGFPLDLGNVAYDFKVTELLAKVDHQWTPEHNLVLRANFSDTVNGNIDPFGGIVAKSRGTSLFKKDWSASASETDILSRRWVNEVRLQYAWLDQDVIPQDPTCDGICDREDEGSPAVDITGLASVGRNRFAPQYRTLDRIQLSDTVSYFGGDHRLKAGFDLLYLSNQATLPLTMGGRYVFSAAQGLSALQALDRGLPASYLQAYGNSSGPFKYRDVALFVQDEWRVSSHLTLKPGLRYQRQLWGKVPPFTVSNLNGTTYTYPWHEDANDIAPRLAVAIDPKGDGRTSIHAAYGLYFENQLLNARRNTAVLDGSPTGLRTLLLRGADAARAWSSPGHRLPEPSTFYPSTEISIDPDMQTPYAQQAAVGFDRALGKDFSLAANFLYARGKEQIGTIDYNPVIPALGAGRRPNDVNGQANTSTSVLQYTTFGETWYKGLTVSLTKRLSHRYQLMASYTLSRAEDNSTDYGSAFLPEDNGRGRNPADPEGLPVGFDPYRERGPATHDQRHRLVVSGLYQLPWSLNLSAIFTAASGRPFNPLAGVDLNGDGNGGGSPPDRARRNPADPTSSVRRNSETMSGQVFLDLRLSKRFRVGSRWAIEGIVEAFNLFDRVNYSEINNVFGTGTFPDNPLPTYGRYEQALPPRQIQLAAKVSF